MPGIPPRLAIIETALSVSRLQTSFRGLGRLRRPRTRVGGRVWPCGQRGSRGPGL